MLAVSLLLPAIVAAEHFLLTPRIVGLGRIIDDLPPADPESKTFRVLYSLYGTLDLLKTLIGLRIPGRPELQTRDK